MLKKTIAFSAWMTSRLWHQPLLPQSATSQSQLPLTCSTRYRTNSPLVSMVRPSATRFVSSDFRTTSDHCSCLGLSAPLAAELNTRSAAPMPTDRNPICLRRSSFSWLFAIDHDRRATERAAIAGFRSIAVSRKPWPREVKLLGGQCQVRAWRKYRRLCREYARAEIRQGRVARAPRAV